MLFATWLRGLKTLAQHTFRKRGGTRTSRARRPTARQLWLETLEDRVVPSQAGMLDPSFGTGGLVTTNLGPWQSANNDVQAAVIQPNGQIVLAGFTNPAPNADNRPDWVTRLNGDGSLDTSFGSNGKEIVNPIGPYMSLALQSDGKIVVAGYSGVVRLNSDGSPDGSFGANGEKTIDNFSAWSVTIQSDGKIVLAGQSSRTAGGYVEAVARLNGNGDLDSSFGDGGTRIIDFGYWANSAHSVALQSDGSIVVAGGANQSNGSIYDSSSVITLARLTSQGCLDTTFGPPGQDGKETFHFNPDGDTADSVAVQSDDKIVVAGRSSPTNFDPLGLGAGLPPSRAEVIRLDSNGSSLDPSFGNLVDPDHPDLGRTGWVTMGFGIWGGPTPIAIQSDGNILVGGNFLSALTLYPVPPPSAFAVARLDTFGNLDTSFGNSGTQLIHFNSGDDTLECLALLPSTGEIAVAGQTYDSADPLNNTDIAVASLAGTGNLDNTFGNSGEATIHYTGGGLSRNWLQGTHSVAVQSDGKVLVAGSDIVGRNRFLAPAAAFRPAVVRYNSDGSLDTTFGNLVDPGQSNLRPGIEIVPQLAELLGQFQEGMAVQSDGKILLSGVIQEQLDPSSRWTTGQPFVVRLDSNGDLDTSFGSGGIEIGVGEGEIVPQPDGKILVLSYFGFYGPPSLARLNSDGSLDTSFGNAGLDANGNVDTSSGPGGIQTLDPDFGYVSLALQGDNIILVGSTGNNSDNTNDFVVTRLDSHGNVDTSFGSWGTQFIGIGDPSDYTNAADLAVEPGPNGGIIVAGTSYSQAFGTYDTGSLVVARLTSNGGLDTGFGSAGGAQIIVFPSQDQWANALALQADGKIVVSGSSLNPDFDNYDFAVARLNSNGSVDTSFGTDGMTTTDFGYQFDDFGAGVAIQPDGNIVVVGQSDTPDTEVFSVARYLGSTKFDTALSVNASAATPLLGDPVSFTATVTSSTQGSPSGTVDFFDTSTATDLGSVSLVNGTATLSTNALAAGIHSIRATYSGDTTFLGSHDDTSLTVEPPASLSEGTVYIFGTSGNDTIVVSQSGTNLLSITVDGTPYTFSLADITASTVNIWGNGGVNNYTINFGNLPATVNIFDNEAGNSLTVNGVANAASNDMTKTLTGPGSGRITWTDDSPSTVTETINYLGVTAQVINARGIYKNYVNDPGNNTVINGGPGANTIVITATEGSGVVINGGPSTNQYVLDLGSLAGPVTINNSNAGASDSVVVNGAPGDNVIAVSGNQVTEGNQNIIVNTAVTSLAVDVSQSSGTAQITVSNVANVQTLALSSKAGDTISVAPPAADVGGPYQITYGDGVTLDASASTDPAHLPLSYSWTINGHAGAASGVRPALTFAQLQALGIGGGQSFAVSVQVNDGQGHVVTSPSTTLTVNKATPSFSPPSMPVVVTDGTVTTILSGVINSGALVPTGVVSVTIDGISGSGAINADGSFSVAFPTASLAVTVHTISYSYAGDSNFASASSSAIMDVTYGILVLTNLSQAKQAGSTIPIQLELVTAGGQDLSAANITVTALNIASVATPNTLLAVQAAGNSNPGNVFQVLGGKTLYYQFNLQTARNLAPGAYLLYFSVLGDPIEHSLQFVLK